MMNVGNVQQKYGGKYTGIKYRRLNKGSREKKYQLSVLLCLLLLLTVLILLVSCVKQLVMYVSNECVETENYDNSSRTNSSIKCATRL